MFGFVTVYEAVQSAKKGTLLVDVRSPEDYRKGHLPGAVNIPLEEFRNGRLQEQLKEFTDDGLVGKIKNFRDAGEPDMIIVYCDTGMRSLSAAKQFDQEGYDVYSISGGIQGCEGYIICSA